MKSYDIVKAKYKPWRSEAYVEFIGEIQCVLPAIPKCNLRARYWILGGRGGWIDSDLIESLGFTSHDLINEYAEKFESFEDNLFSCGLLTNN